MKLRMAKRAKLYYEGVAYHLVANFPNALPLFKTSKLAQRPLRHTVGARIQGVEVTSLRRLAISTIHPLAPGRADVPTIMPR
jgi:hypothetical protein